MLKIWIVVSEFVHTKILEPENSDIAFDESFQS